MTYGEYKEKVRDLGFEENETISDYSSIVRNACNIALNSLFDSIVTKLESYYRRELSSDTDTWQPIRPTLITEDTPDTAELELPDNLQNLIPLLASYFIWIDDDITRATSYWNAYDTFKNDILDACYSNVKAKITGGISWGR